MLSKIFPAELAHLYAMLTFIEDYALSRGAERLFLEQLILATEEALVNVINYGYPKEAPGFIGISCQEVVQPRGIKVTIYDQGVPFNPIENIPPCVPAASRLSRDHETSLGGYGIYILAGLMDKIEYQRSNEGNILSLTKYAHSS